MGGPMLQLNEHENLHFEEQIRYAYELQTKEDMAMTSIWIRSSTNHSPHSQG